MLFLKRVIFFIILMLFINIFSFFAFQSLFSIPLPLLIILAVVLFAAYVYYNIHPRGGLKHPSRRLKVIANGCELTMMASVCLAAEIVITAALFFIIYGAWEPLAFALTLINIAVALILITVLFLNGFTRVFAASTQLGVKLRVAVFCLWWFPIVNVVLFFICASTASKEYKFERMKFLRDERRRDRKICDTTYPILMVHGIFFRDWKHFLYWGRIPDALIANGADIYYGKQQSAATIAESASEIKERIIEVIAETGREKVNIIAHSKGGLDARYAISCLGMSDCVASLTTVCTPHYGCSFLGKLLKFSPDGLVAALDNKYKSIFKKLGDTSPEFLAGLADLTPEKCAAFNEQAPDAQGILYQSVGAQMKNRRAAMLPLGLGYSLIKRLDGDNDGLVSVKSSKWGKFLGVVKPPRKKGISHGDMIDLTRKNIYGFDVCEFYVELVKKLKEQGL